MKGKRDVAEPRGWAALYEKLKASPNDEVRQQAQTLAATFGGTVALAEARKTLGDPSAMLEARQAALESLVSARDADTLRLLLELTLQPGPLRPHALRGLAAYDDERVASAIVIAYPKLDTAEKREALNTLLARPRTALALLAAVDAKTIERGEITVPLVRQLQNLKNQEVDAWLAKNWGTVRTSPVQKQAEIAKFKEFCTPELIARADATHGRALFMQTCAACHTLHGVGGKIGPELPGSFEDIDYLLQNIVDPNALIGKDYLQTFIETKDGQVLSGIIAGEDPAAVTLKTLSDLVTVQRADIRKLEVSPQSMMPEGLLTSMDEESVRDLFAYLRQRQQVPMLATAANVNDVFNGSDLSRWHASDADAWRINNGYLVGVAGRKLVRSLISDMVLRDFKLTAKIKVTGLNPAAEIVLRGEVGSQTWSGWSLSLGPPSQPNLWRYLPGRTPERIVSNTAVKLYDWVPVEVTAKGESLDVVLYEQPVFHVATPDMRRTILGFYIFGESAELRVKDVKVELLGP